MATKVFTKEKKDEYMALLSSELDKTSRVIVISVDNVGSKQMQQIRMALRGTATIVMGKNTRMRRVLREKIAEGRTELEKLLNLVKKNCGFVFCYENNMKAVADIIVENKVPAAAKPGAIAPTDVFVPPGSTGLDPSSTSFFQALNISTKINRGAIEIVKEVHLIQAGDKVNSSQATLLSKLNINPFFYGVLLTAVYDDGLVYSTDVLNLTDADIAANVVEAVANVTCISLATGYPALSAVPHLLIDGWKNILSIGLEANMGEFVPAVKDIEDYLADPSAFAAPAAAGGDDAGAAAGGNDDDGSGSDSDSSASGMGFDLFG